jgi:hypothetical protein
VEDLIQLLFFAALIMFALLGRKKKKPPLQQKPRPPRVQPRPRPQREVSDAARVEPQRASSEPAKQKSLAEELFKMLQGQVEGVEPEPTPPAPEPVVFAEEAQSLETLEPAGTTSHQRFHDLYIEELPSEPEPQPHVEPYREELPSEPERQPHVAPYRDQAAARKEQFEFTRKKLQRAFILKEVLGPPKGLE